MDLELEPLEHTRLSLGGVEQIRELIANGSLEVGQRLPSERQLAKMLGVSRQSVRETLRVLETEGYISVQPGRGVFVKSRLPAPVRSQYAAWLVEHRDDVVHLLEARSVLNAGGAALAAIRATDRQIEHLGTILRKMEEAIARNDVDEIAQADKDFHFAVNAASGNKVLPTLTDAMNALLEDDRLAVMAIPGWPQQSHRFHEEILQAIASRDPTGAQRVMNEHSQRVVRTVLTALNSPDASGLHPRTEAFVQPDSAGASRQPE